MVGSVARARRSTRVEAGIDHLTVGDHVSFADGHGADGLIQAAALLSAHPGCPCRPGSTWWRCVTRPSWHASSRRSRCSPRGRFTFGVGVGGDDPRELELCGINPRERGARTTEALRCVRLFMTGEEVEFHGRFFDLRGAIRPAPAVPIPILVGGRSDAALVRAGQLGDGWLALWVSPRRFEEAVDRIDAVAAEAGRERRPLAARASALGRLRRLPRAARERLSRPCRRPTRFRSIGSSGMCRVARPRRSPTRWRRTSRSGCRRFNFVPEAASLPDAIEAVAEVKALLATVRT